MATLQPLAIKTAELQFVVFVKEDKKRLQTFIKNNPYIVMGIGFIIGTVVIGYKIIQYFPLACSY